jgi:hypothetical protein
MQRTSSPDIVKTGYVSISSRSVVPLSFPALPAGQVSLDLEYAIESTLYGSVAW